MPSKITRLQALIIAINSEINAIKSLHRGDDAAASAKLLDDAGNAGLSVSSGARLKELLALAEKRLDAEQANEIVQVKPEATPAKAARF
jgi:hypothetical protein